MSSTVQRPPKAQKAQRADAKRNRDLLLGAALAAFTEDGADASLEDIARRAGVGVGTLYRHFPSRQELLEAVYVEEVEALCRSVELDGASSWDALAHWLDRFVTYASTKRALMDEMMATIGSDAPVFKTCHAAIYAAGEPLVAAAQKDAAMRPDVEFADVIRMVGGLTMMRNCDQDQIRRVLAVAIDGLRYRPPASPPSSV